MTHKNQPALWFQNQHLTCWTRRERERERNLYKDRKTDKIMLLLKLVGDDETLVGAINWFAVLGTSMNNTNLLVTGDN